MVYRGKYPSKIKLVCSLTDKAGMFVQTNDGKKYYVTSKGIRSAMPNCAMTIEQVAETSNVQPYVKD